MSAQHTPLVLIILDGWGHREDGEYNAIASAKTPVWDQLWKNYPHILIEGSGLSVGLPKGQMGNSEVGHLHMGAGRPVLQDLTRIDSAIEQGDFFKNPVFISTFKEVIATQKALHIFGLLSEGGVHSHIRHIQALIKMAAEQGVKQLYVHAFLDGRDTPPKSALRSISALNATFKEVNCGKMASIIGRYYAMDRDKRWERTQRAYDMLTLDETSFHAASAEIGLEMAYARGETDEFVQATCIDPAVKIQDGDAVIFMNFRADRARQLTRAFTDPAFNGYKRQVWPKLSRFVTLTEYARVLK